MGKHTRVFFRRPIGCLFDSPHHNVGFGSSWWHMVVNLDPMNIAATHNYVSDTNLSNVLRFLDTKRGQVSGCRDRDDSIKPEELYEKFVEALEDRYPEGLELAKKESQWTCRAWKDETREDRRSYESEEVAECRDHKRNVMEEAKVGAEGFRFSFL